MTTLICDSKQLKKLSAISSSLNTIKNVIYFEGDGAANDSDFSGSSSKWTISSFSEVEKLGKRSPVIPNLPSKNGTAVIMYTSGSTGLPKVCFFLLYLLFEAYSSNRANQVPVFLLKRLTNWKILLVLFLG